ncbi:flagellin [Oribacterium parvum]|uniref:flagellin N-terminal helical domain-containing protein n=1 Tax=Oribacterium parvum TaxID=1501329 RepID=UPI0028DB33F7|nr:flagellin [Oribacterium parvum]
MIIQHNIGAVNAHRNLFNNNWGLQKNIEKLSSGYRINRSADDAAGLAISEDMRSRINGIDQATVNAQDAIGLIQTAEGALTETHAMLQRMVTLATQSANGTYTSVARADIKLEVDALNEEISRIAKYTEFNGVYPLKGGSTAANAVTITFQIGPSAAETLKVKTLDMAAASIGVGGTGTNGVDVTSVSSANASIKRINDAITKVSSYRAELGAAQNRLEHTINNLKVTSENMTAAESRIRDTDMAKEMSAFTKNNILVQASQAMLAQANQTPQGILQLLR